MHIDARKLDHNTLIEGDICIVGAGAAGISIALDLIDTPYKVILLEGGGFQYDEKVQDLYGGSTSGQKYFPLKSTRLHYFGGTTGHWAGMVSPFDPIDFKERPWIPHSGWPITLEDLEPYYIKTHKYLELEHHQYDLNYWEEQGFDLKTLPLDQKVVWNKLWQLKGTRYGEVYRNSITDAKNIHLYTYANAVDIRCNDEVSSVSEIIVKNYENKTHRVRAKHFIMACGTIQNARLLLASNSQAPNGLGNDNDLVGRYFMEHLEVSCAELWLTNPQPTEIYMFEPPVHAELALTEKIQAREKMLNGTSSLIPLSWAKHAKPRMETWQHEDPRISEKNMFTNWRAAAEKSEKEEGAILQAFELVTRMEQSPNPNSRVTLSKEKDALGVPRAHLHWELNALDKHSVRRLFQILGQEFGASGIGRVKLYDFLRDEKDDTFPDSTNGGWHHMGTTRMADDPKNGVVDANCRVHGIDNLYIAGASCYATSAAPNPTLTLTALSLRLSDHLKNNIKVS